MAEEKDIWRDTPIRYLGYANEIGESFRHVAPKLVGPSYMLAFAYVFGDTLDKGNKCYIQEKNQLNSKVMNSSVDALIWQTLASVAVPGFIINRIVGLSRKSLGQYAKGNFKFIPVCIGLGSIPLIIHPIDNATTWCMDRTLRKFY